MMMGTLADIKRASVTTLIFHGEFIPPTHRTCASVSFSGCGAFVSDLNELLESHPIVEHNYRVRDSHMTNRSIRWKERFAGVFWKGVSQVFLERASRGGLLFSFVYKRKTLFPLESLSIPRKAIFKRKWPHRRQSKSGIKWVLKDVV